ncbi:hypothetical protein A7U60_g1324 [Sanghuangporus baumii]|uniref:Chromo domain-containing protein n=1 Tax=Sanghuangporus baumii TaxID=108892 RepID=A0A9Q5I4B3_SANBA|nr:hypothetical protein A7U60_g1324 [Sanghuangporus baumii]
MRPLDFMGVGTASSNLSVEEFTKHVKEVHELAQSNLVKANKDMKRFYDRHAGKSISYEAGQKVFLDGWNIKIIRPMKKMDDKWFGPFEKKVHPVFNEILLKLAIQPSFESQKKPPPPPPVIIDEQEEYKVEEILDSHLHRGKLQFLVKWVGYEEATWQLESDVKDNAQESIQEFYHKHPGAPRKLTIPQQSLQALYKFMTSEGLCGWLGCPTLKEGIYRNHIFQLHGLPWKIIHDRGVQFNAKMMRKLYKLLHIEGNPSTVYHPQTDGQTERVNQELEQYLRLYINHR